VPGEGNGTADCEDPENPTSFAQSTPFHFLTIMRN
jgi:hypothetical protein